MNYAEIPDLQVSCWVRRSSCANTWLSCNFLHTGMDSSTAVGSKTHKPCNNLPNSSEIRLGCSHVQSASNPESTKSKKPLTHAASQSNVNLT